MTHLARPAFTLGLIFAIIILAGCRTAAPAETAPPVEQSTPIVASPTVRALDATPIADAPAAGEIPIPTGTSGLPEPAESPAATPFESRSDAQGAVEVIAAPLFNPGEASSLDFKIILDTHSVELVFDLAALAELKTDTGVTLQPLRWEAPSGGHHVEGVLSFPALVNGKPALDGARQFTLTIKNLDAPLRTLTWEW